MAYKRMLRRSQLIQPYGVGSIVPFPCDDSIVIGGIHLWDTNDSNVIKDERLAARLRVNEFRTPPEFIHSPLEDGPSADGKNMHIYGYRFPQLFYCPHCKLVKKVSLVKEGSVKCNHKDTNKEGDPERVMIPERFVVACPEGHLMDFPYIEYIHEGCGLPPSEYLNHSLVIRKSSNQSATLAGITYKCLKCGAEKNLSGITTSGALDKITFFNGEPNMCPGYMPWLGNYYEKCNVKTKDLMVVQKGGTNVWFGETISSIYIPMLLETEVDKKYRALVEKAVQFIESLDEETKENVLKSFAKNKNVDYVLLKKYFDEAIEEHTQSPYENMSEDEYRKIEYDILKKDSGNDSSPLYCKNLPISSYDSRIWKYFKSVSLVYKMTETRAFIGFSRLFSSNKTTSEFKKQIAKDGPANWLPAIQVLGEGIFIEFNLEEINKWKSDSEVMERSKTLTHSFNTSFFGKNKQVHLINPEYVMIHTFSHLLVNELSKKCGYGSSALRERLYVNKSGPINMCGVLIYTASGDSEGSLGGLVREGKPKRLEDIICDSLRNAEWCTADPICVESKGQGPDSCNLAACHNCSLIPETCCELGNRLLDRGMLIDVKNKKTGYFGELLKELM